MFDDIVKTLGKTFKLGVVFEVADDPDDLSKYFGYIKPIDVWVFPSGKEQELAKVTVKSIANSDGGACVRRITKATAVELRQYGMATLDKGGFLYVIAAPTPEWAHLYDERKYPAMPIKAGYIYNFSVSLPAKT